MKDSLWSLDLFRCESIGLQTYWVPVVMDQYTRRIIGFGIRRGVVDGLALCRMFSKRFEVPVCRNISAPITIRCAGFINGRQTFEFWALRKLRRFHTLPSPIRSLSD
jgi:hypothetical protein